MLRKKLTPLFPLCQNLQKRSVAHCECSYVTRQAQKQDLRSEALIDSRQAPSPSNGQSWNIINMTKLLPQYLWVWLIKRNESKIHLNIWSSARYCFKHLVSSADDSESRPNGFSTMTLVHPFSEEALRLAHLTTSTNMFGGIDK